MGIDTAEQISSRSLRTAVLPRRFSALNIAPVLICAFALAWVVLRASVQSITIDEADSYIGGVLQDWPSQWYPTSGNHVLNTILMRLLTWIFGMSHLSARGPALIGAAVYIVASYRICRLVTEDWHLRVAALVCLVYNPFVMDYMVAARGYSLAMAFLMSAIFLVLREFLDTRRERWPRTAALVSAFVALSFSANFSFAYIDVLCLILFTAWAAQGIYRSEGWRPAIRLIAAAVWPGLLVLLVFSLSVVVAWPKGQLYYGAESLSELMRSLTGSMFYELNQELVNPLLQNVLQLLRHRVLMILWITFVLQVAFAAKRHRKHFQAIVYVLAILVLALLMHWLQFKLFKVPLPKERTGLFFVVLSFVAFVLATALPAFTRPARVVRTVSLLTLAVCAVYFVGCLRVATFHEWSFGADVRAAYAVIERISREKGVHEFPTAWQYASSLEFYRRLHHDDQIEHFRFLDPQPPRKDVYVLPWNEFEKFIRDERLTVIYRGPHTELVIAARNQ